jgi:hypothetical protein
VKRTALLSVPAAIAALIAPTSACLCGELSAFVRAEFMNAAEYRYIEPGEWQYQNDPAEIGISLREAVLPSLVVELSHSRIFSGDADGYPGLVAARAGVSAEVAGAITLSYSARYQVARGSSFGPAYQLSDATTHSLSMEVRHAVFSF